MFDCALHTLRLCWHFCYTFLLFLLFLQLARVGVLFFSFQVWPLFHFRVNSETVNILTMWWRPVGMRRLRARLCQLLVLNTGTQHIISQVYTLHPCRRAGSSAWPQCSSSRGVIVTFGYQVRIVIVPPRSSCKMFKTNDFNLGVYFM